MRAGMAVLLLSCLVIWPEPARAQNRGHAAFQNPTLRQIRDRYVGDRHDGGRHHYHGGHRGGAFFPGFVGGGFGYLGGGFGVNVGFPYYSVGGFFPGNCWLPGYSFSYGIAPYGVYYNSGYNLAEYYLPYYEPAELHYGPKAMERFLLDHRAGQAAATANAEAQAAAAQLNALERLLQPAVQRRARVSNDTARERAAHFLQIGDELFQQQEFHAALQRYKTAAEAAPDLAEPYFRQGHALVATRRFDLAADAFKRAVALSQDLERDGFLLDQLYADNRIAKESHLELLASTALDQPNNADLLYLVGLYLFYDGQAERAERFFRRAAELSGGQAEHVRPFLMPDAPAEQEIAT